MSHFSNKPLRFMRLAQALTGFSLTLSICFAHAEPRSYSLPEETAQFRPAPGVEIAQANCMTCHSADYVSLQPWKQGKDFWTAEVNKMVKVYGAPISSEDAEKIITYLSAAY
jgi:mono/diheme cytochrome c family protein